VAGASVAVEPMEAGRSQWPPAFFKATAKDRGRLGRLRGLGLIGSKPDEWTDVPVPAYLIHHPGVGPILVDTGLHPSVASDPKDNLGRSMRRHYSLEAGQDVASRLRDRGISPTDIAVVILTHLHNDHASAVSLFPESIFVVSSQEWDEATSVKVPTLHGYRPAQFDYAFDWCTVDFDGDFVESYGPFGRTFDLFGDGSIRLAFTPGHSAGHVSVIARLPRRDFVIVGDAAYNWAQFQGEAEPLLMHDEHNWRRSLKELQHYRQAYPYALLVPGHDPEYWEKLDARYAE
jgi:N-acyl homoserine lactone hydrolase